MHLRALLLGGGGALAVSALSGLLAPVTGSTRADRGVAVAAILAGLAAGVLSGGRSRRGSGKGAIPLIVSALFLAAAPWILPAFSGPAGAILSLAPSLPILLLLLRFTLAFLLALVPGICLGSAFASFLDEPGWGGTDPAIRSLRLALAASGAALGTANAGFRLDPWGGETAVALAGGLLLLAAAALAGLSAFGAPGPERAHSPAQGDPGSGGAIFALGGLVWGGAAVTLLLGWDRILGLVFGPFPDAMARSAGLFLAGCALGSLALFFAGGGGRRGSLAIPILSGLAGLLAAATLRLVNRLPLDYLALSPLSGTAPFSFSVKSWGVGVLLVLPAGVALGALLPLLATPRGNGEGSGRAPGAGWGGSAWILLGGCLAALVVPPAVIPSVGFRSALVAASALILAFSGAAFALSAGASRILRAAGVLFALAATLFVAMRGVSGDPRLLASGVYRYAVEILDSFDRNPEYYRAARLKADVPFYREGGEMTVAVERVEAAVSPILALTADGVVAATTYVDLVPQILSAEIPLLMRPEAGEVLLIGYGSGITAGSMLLHPLRHLDLSEPEGAVVDASRQFEPANRVPRSDPRVTLRAGDPRDLLRWKGAGAYDLILCRDTAPESFSARTRTTESFYRLAASRLRKGGLFAQVLPLQGLDPAGLASVARTARSAFADAMLVQTYYHEVLLLASDRTIRFDLPSMEAALARERVRSDLGRIGLARVESLVIRHRLSGPGLEAFMRQGRILTDRGAPLAWAGFRPGGAPVVSASLDAMDRYSTGLGERIGGLKDGAEGNRRLLAIARAAIATGDAPRAADLAEALMARGDVADGHQVLGDAHYLRREQIDSVAEWHKALEADPKNVNALKSLADFSSDRQNFPAAEEYLRQGLAVAPSDPELLYHHGRVLYYLKRYKESEGDLARALGGKKESEVPLALYYLGLIQKEKKNFTGAAEFLRRYLQWAYAQGRLTAVEADVHLALAEVYTAMSLPDLAQQQKKAADALQQKLKEAARSKEKAVMELLRKP